jgi:hypothetical protein
MTWLTLAAKNVSHQARQYTAFFLSSAFAVWMFFLFVGLQYHPALAPELERLEMVPTFGLVATLVAIFSILFIFYASTAFLRARKRELGIFSLVGMLPRQIAAIIFAENLLIGAAAIVAGVGGGMITGKIFFLLVGRVLSLTAAIPYHLSLMAVLLTVLIFAGVFLLVSMLSGFTLRRLSVAEVFRSAARPRIPPTFRWWLAALGVVCLAAGYRLLLMPGTWTESEPRVWPGIALSVAGTYLFFHQGSVAALQMLRSRQGLYYRRTSLLVISQMVTKVRDNAKVLFMVSILTTLVLVPLTTVVTAFVEAEQQALEWAPIGLVVEQPKGGQAHEQAMATLQEHGVPVGRQATMLLLPTLTRYRSNPTMTIFNRTGIVSVSAYNQWTALSGGGAAPVTVPAGEGVLLGTYAPTGVRQDVGVTFGADIKAGQSLPVDMQINVIPVDLSISQIPSKYYSLIIVDDPTFAQLSDRFGSADDIELHAFELPRWKESLPALEALAAVDWRIRGTALTYHELMLEGQTGMLVLGFIVVLFFLATGQMLYFKLFTDLTAERQQYQALFRVGLREREVRRVISVQTLVLFFAPLVVALAHSWVMVSMFSRFGELKMGAPFWAVGGAYLLLFGGYYLAARRTYVKAILA